MEIQVNGQLKEEHFNLIKEACEMEKDYWSNYKYEVLFREFVRTNDISFFEYVKEIYIPTEKGSSRYGSIIFSDEDRVYSFMFTERGVKVYCKSISKDSKWMCLSKEQFVKSYKNSVYFIDKLF